MWRYEIDFRARVRFLWYAVRGIGGFLHNGIDAQRKPLRFGEENIASKFGNVIEIAHGFIAGEKRENQKQDEKDSAEFCKGRLS